MKQKLQTLLCTLLLFGFISVDFAVAQDGLQEVTIRDLNTYDNLENFNEIPDHPLAQVPVRFTAVVVSYPRSSGLSGYISDDGSIGRIHLFVADTSAASMGQDGMYMRIVNAFDTNAFSDLENLDRGSIVTLNGRLTFFGETSQFEVDEIEEVPGSVFQPEFNDYEFLLEPVIVDPTEYHLSTGQSEVKLDLEAYQRFNNMYVRIEQGIAGNYDPDDQRPSFSVIKNGVFTGHRDVSLRYRNDRPEYRNGYNFRRSEDGDFELPPIGSAINVNGFLSIEDLTFGGLNFASGGGFFISPMEDGILWIQGEQGDVKLKNGVSQNGNFEWPVDFEFIAAPPQVLDLSLSPASDDNVYTPDQTITVSALTAAPDDDPSVTIDSVIVNYTSRTGGAQRIALSDVGGGNYEAELPALVAFESPSLFVEAYGSNELSGRFPVTGNISFFVDGGTITSIETIQRTADDQVGPSPLQGLTGLDFDITATVTSAPSDGVIAVQEGPEPWSGIFLAIGPNTASLERGDVVNITGANVNEAEIAFNSNTYSYLSNLSLSVEGSADLMSVVPVLTTEEFNEPAAPGEAWEGMLVTFENVRMLADQGFGEVSFASIVGDTDDTLPETVYINWDTRAGAIGETGFPQDFNRHAILGSDLTSVTGLVTYTFDIPKVIPRNLNDIQGENYTIPRPLFGLTSPATGAEVGVFGGNNIEVSWQSFNPRDYDSDTVTFEWVLFGADSTEIVAVPSDNEGSSAQVTLPFEVVDVLLADLDVADGESVDVLWSVRASDGENTILKSNFLAGSGVGTTRTPGVSLFEAAYNELTLTRGELTSNEEFAGAPRTFELQQNYPNPFNPSTQINYAVPQQSEVKIEVYNVIGRRVAVLVDREMAPGNYTVNFDASSLSSGMYFYRLQAGSTLLTKKMTLIK